MAATNKLTANFPRSTTSKELHTMVDANTVIHLFICTYMDTYMHVVDAIMMCIQVNTDTYMHTYVQCTIISTCSIARRLPTIRRSERSISESCFILSRRCSRLDKFGR